MKRCLDQALPGWLSKPALALLIAVALAGCVSSSPGMSYRLKGPNDTVGYSDEQLAPNRFRVSFAGPGGAKLVEVEDLLLRRAAEITLKAGYTHFVFAIRKMEASVYGRRSGERWNPDLGLLFDCGRDSPRPESTIDMVSPGFCAATPILQYTATSEIVVMKPDEASRNFHALAAREVLARLAPAEIAGEPPA
jgi:hypothetical protein